MNSDEERVEAIARIIDPDPDVWVAPEEPWPPVVQDRIDRRRVGAYSKARSILSLTIPEGFKLVPIEPVAWRYRYIYPEKPPSRWAVRQTPIESCEARDFYAAIEAQSLYAASPPISGGDSEPKTDRQAGGVA